MGTKFYFFDLVLIISYRYSLGDMGILIDWERNHYQSFRCEDNCYDKFPFVWGEFILTLHYGAV